MAASLSTITRRPVKARDDDLLRELFAESRPELMMLPPEVRTPILDLQVRAQHQQYAASYPHASHEILVADGTDVGRLILDEGIDAVRVVDITVGQSHRGQGIATSALREVIDAAAQRGLPVRLSVWFGNEAARRLYERLGFVVLDGGDGHGYLELQRNATTEGD